MQGFRSMLWLVAPLVMVTHVAAKISLECP